MDAVELKNYLVKQLIKIDDEAFLQALKVIIDSSTHTLKDDEESPKASVEDTIDLEETPEEKAEREIAAWLKELD